jgi:hypothetical protein
MSFSHNISNSGGGGERVLWAAIHHLQKTELDVVSVVYTGDSDATKEEIIAKVKVGRCLIHERCQHTYTFYLSRTRIGLISISTQKPYRSPTYVLDILSTTKHGLVSLFSVKVSDLWSWAGKLST